jgi:hypothetical protein
MGTKLSETGIIGVSSFIDEEAEGSCDMRGLEPCPCVKNCGRALESIFWGDLASSSRRGCPASEQIMYINLKIIKIDLLVFQFKYI